MVNWFIDNISWIFSGIGVAVLSWVYLSFKRHRESQRNVVINNIVQTPLPNKNPGVSLQELMCYTFILFIDDEAFNVVDILKEQGWKQTKLIKDVKSLNDERVKQANIIFVDVNGVGEMLFPEKQGIGLASALKKRYPDKKVVIYSATRAGDRFDEELQGADYRLAKNAEPYRFVQLVEKFAREIYAKGNH